MKKIPLLLVLLLSAFKLFANKYTLDNSPGSPADFTNATDAMSGVADGDTIYVQPSSTSYGIINLNKRIVLLGAGHNPEFTSYRSEFSDIRFYTGSGESIIKGLYVSNLIVIMAFQNVPNVVLSHNFLTGQNVMAYESWATAPTWIIESNVIYSTSNWISIGAITDGSIFRNNLFCTVTASLFYGLPAGTILDHNTFVFSTGSQVENLINGISINITNNLFYINAPSTGNLHGACTSCFWENNMTYSLNNTINDLPGSNYNNIDPLFVNVPDNSPLFLYSNDYHLTALSPALNAASDGTDIGLTGGIAPFNMFGFDPSLPRLKEVNLLQNAAPVNGTITLRVRGVASGQ